MISEHSKKLDGVLLPDHPADLKLLQAATICAQALSCSRVDDEVRFHTLSKVLDGLGGGNMKRKMHNSHEFQQISHAQISNFEVPKLNENDQVSSQKLFSFGEVNESQEQIFLFLNKAIVNGALEMKDMNLVLRCIQDSSMEALRGKELVPKDVQNDVFDDETQAIFARKFEHSKCSKERDDSVCPVDNSHPVITLVGSPQGASVPQTSSLPGNQGRLHPQCSHVPPCIAAEKDKSKSNTLPQVRALTNFSDKPISNCVGTILGNSEKATSKDDTHVSHALSPHSSLSLAEPCPCKVNSHVKAKTQPLSFLEAAKQSLRNPLEEDTRQHHEFEGKKSQTTSSSSTGSLIFTVDQRILQKRMELCRFSILGKLTLTKGDEPWTWVKLKGKLDALWGLTSKWRLISIGKGFFHIILTNQEEYDKVWSKEVLLLKPGILRLQGWKFGFDPTVEKNTRAQVWFRIHQLPWCLWDASVILGIASKIGEPLRIDKNTLEGSFGHYARVLIEVDLSKPVTSSILVDCNKQVIEVQISPESMPVFCTGCNSIGHSSNECRLSFKSERPQLPIGNRRDLRNFELAEPIGISNSKRNAQQSEGRRKKVQVIEKENVKTAEQSDRKHAKNIVETVTDFSANVGSHSAMEKREDFLVISNQFAVLESEEGTKSREECTKGKNVIEMETSLLDHPVAIKRYDRGGNSGQFGNEEFENPNLPERIQDHLQEFEDEVNIPKVPARWSDVLDEEENIEQTYPFQEANAIILKARADFEKSYGSAADFRAKLQDVWLDKDDTYYDRDMCAEMDHYKNSARATKTFIANIPKKRQKSEDWLPATARKELISLLMFLGLFLLVAF